MIEEDAADGEDSIGLAVIDCGPVRDQLGGAVGTAWMEAAALVQGHRV